MFGAGFFFFDVFVDQAGHASAAKTAGRFVLGFAFGVAHEALVKRFFRADKIVIVKSELAAIAALQVLCHGISLWLSIIKCPAEPMKAAHVETDCRILTISTEVNNERLAVENS